MAVRKTIDLQRVVQVAVVLADQHGFEAVTLAAVASELGIKIPSLYNHVSGLPGLRYQMRLWGSLQLVEQLRRAAVGKAGDDAIFSLAQEYRSFAQAHPGIYPTTLQAATPDETEMMAVSQEFLELLFVILQPYQFAETDALHVIRGLRSVLHGFVDLEIAGGFGMPLERDESFRRLIQVFIDGLHAASSKTQD